MDRKGKILNQLHVALDDLCFVSHSPTTTSNKTCFMGELDNHVGIINKSIYTLQVKNYAISINLYMIGC